MTNKPTLAIRFSTIALVTIVADNATLVIFSASNSDKLRSIACAIHSKSRPYVVGILA
ncbi:hypothetical protein SDC9_207186 [bioreactor metagenome]|uniref:Uncharacterized protein n=1 Tax=bioreactor metagenome TaxID=1076179 RepID=A0A645J6X2_9ZZZZ